MKKVRTGKLRRDARVVAVSHQVSSDLGDEVVILDLKAGAYVGLEEVGARVWHLLSEATTVGEIENTLMEEYDVDPERCARDLDTLLQGLIDKGLVEIVDGQPA